MTIDISKTYRTRDGREVRIYATDGGGPYPVHGAIKDLIGNWSYESWTEDGASVIGGKTDNDIGLADPHGILPRHRELLAEALDEIGYPIHASKVRKDRVNSQAIPLQSALIALAKLDAEKGVR